MGRRKRRLRIMRLEERIVLDGAVADALAKSVDADPVEAAHDVGPDPFEVAEAAEAHDAPDAADSADGGPEGPDLADVAVAVAEAATVQDAPAQGEDTTELLQFTAGGHVLGFGSDSVYAASSDHALRVEFVDALGSSPQSGAGGAGPPVKR